MTYDILTTNLKIFGKLGPKCILNEVRLAGLYTQRQTDDCACIQVVGGVRKGSPAVMAVVNAWTSQGSVTES